MIPPCGHALGPYDPWLRSHDPQRPQLDRREADLLPGYVSDRRTSRHRTRSQLHRQRDQPGEAKLEFALRNLTPVGGGWVVVAAGAPDTPVAGANQKFQAVVTKVGDGVVTVNKVQYLTGAGGRGRLQGRQTNPRWSLVLRLLRARPNPAVYTYPLQAAMRPLVIDYTTMQRHRVTGAHWLATSKSSETTYRQMTVTNGQLTAIEAIYTP